MIGAAHLGIIAGATPRAGGGAGHLHWRVFFPNADGVFLNITELEMRTAVGGSDACIGGTTAASTTYSSNLPAYAFDGDSGTVWGSNGDANQWLAYEFATPKEIVQFKLTVVRSNAPLGSCKLQYSDNGSDWTDSGGLMAVRTWRDTVGLTQEFEPLGAKTYWRIYFTENVSGGYTCVSELEFRESIGGATRTWANMPGKVDSAYAGATDERDMVDGDSASSGWESGATLPHWVWYAFGKNVDIVQLALTNGWYTGEAPKTFAVQSSPDGINWTTEWDVTGETGWSTYETRVFSA